MNKMEECTNQDRNVYNGDKADRREENILDTLPLFPRDKNYRLNLS